MGLYPQGNREMSKLCKWNKDKIRSVVFETSLWGDIKGKSEGADARGGDRADSKGEDTCSFYCSFEK